MRCLCGMIWLGMDEEAGECRKLQIAMTQLCTCELLKGKALWPVWKCKWFIKSETAGHYTINISHDFQLESASWYYCLFLTWAHFLFHHQTVILSERSHCKNTSTFHVLFQSCENVAPHCAATIVLGWNVTPNLQLVEETHDQMKIRELLTVCWTKHSSESNLQSW